MTQDSEHLVTGLLAQWSGGNEGALAQLTPLVYQELRALAQRHLRGERQDHTIQRTALVHEAFVRLVNQQTFDIRGRGHFFALASTIMRRILVDHARARLASKRGGGAPVVSLHELGGAAGSAERDDSWGTEPEPGLSDPGGESDNDVAAIDEALKRLEELDPRQARVVEMRYFGGLTIEETAEALEISDATVKREWTLARAWLRRELSRET